MESLTRSAPRARGPLIEAGALYCTALLLRLASTWALGDGAPFGPDGTGAEAAVVLGGHLYPLHVALIGLFGSGRVLSVLAGALNCVLLWAWGRKQGLGGTGGWLAAASPLLIYTSALSAGDSPALSVVLVGALLATRTRLAAVLGGALALASVAVKPVVLPALVLLLPTPWAIVGLSAALPFAARWLGPLWSPRPDGGLLGTWWQGSGGRPPSGFVPLVDMLGAGLAALLHTPLWTALLLLPLALLPLLQPGRLPRSTPLCRLSALAGLFGLLVVAALFGERLAPRYLTASFAVLLPWVGACLPRGAALVLLWPSAALVTQLALERGRQDPGAGVPISWQVPLPKVDAEALFDECSTAGATAMRLQAGELARTLPLGASVTVEHRVHGREGELVWPLRVARPDIRIRVETK